MRRLAVALIVAGFVAIGLVVFIGRPPIGQAEFTRHKIVMTSLLIGGGLTAAFGFIAVYCHEKRDQTPNQDRPWRRRPPSSE